jgi:membrane-associated HD superfamily phosphohydrolase
MGFVAYFGGNSALTYYPLSFGILSQVFMVLAGLTCLVFALLLKKRHREGLRRFTLIIVSLSLSIAAVILLFLSLIQFRDVNDLLSVGLVARYHYGLVLQGIVLLGSVYIQWFFFIKIRHYIK